MKLNRTIGILLWVSVNVCWTMELGLGRRWHSDKITLEEISLEDYIDHLPAITLGHEENGSYNNWNTDGFYSWDRHASLTPSHYTINIPNEHRDKFIPIVNEIGVPIVEEIPIKIPYIVPQTVWQPYPVLVPVTKPVPYEVVKYIIKHVERKVPTPVEKIVPVPMEKLIPFEVERHLAVPIIKRVPFKIPIFKTIIHRSKPGFKRSRY